MSKSEISKKFGRRLRQERRRAGISRRDLGEVVGFAESYIGLLERAERSPSLEALHDLANALGVEPSSLLAPDETGSAALLMTAVDIAQHWDSTSQSAFVEMVRTLDRVVPKQRSAAGMTLFIVGESEPPHHAVASKPRRLQEVRLNPVDEFEIDGAKVRLQTLRTGKRLGFELSAARKGGAAVGVRARVRPKGEAPITCVAGPDGRTRFEPRRFSAKALPIRITVSVGRRQKTVTLRLPHSMQPDVLSDTQ